MSAIKDQTTDSPRWTLRTIIVSETAGVLERVCFSLNYSGNAPRPDFDAFVKGKGCWFCQIPGISPAMFDAVRLQPIDRNRANMLDQRPFLFKGGSYLPASCKHVTEDLGECVAVSVNGGSGVVMRRTDFEQIVPTLKLEAVGARLGLPKFNIDSRGFVEFMQKTLNPIPEYD